MTAVACHVKIPIAESEKAAAEDTLIEKTILRKYINLFVGDNCTREEQLVACFITKTVHSLGLCGSALLDFVTLVCNDKVSIEAEKLVLKPPTRFVIDNYDLQSIIFFCRLQSVSFLCGRAF